MSGPRTARHDLLPLFNVINHIPAILQCLLFLAHDGSITTVKINTRCVLKGKIFKTVQMALWGTQVGSGRPIKGGWPVYRGYL